jgi:hypothetical protein
VPPLVVIEHLEVVEQLRFRVCVTFESIAQLEGHRREPALHGRVVVGIAAAAHAADDSVVREDPLIVLAA